MISPAANAEGENPLIAPNRWVEIKGSDLAPGGDARIWQGSDFVKNQMPAQLDGVSVTPMASPRTFTTSAPRRSVSSRRRMR